MTDDTNNADAPRRPTAASYTAGPWEAVVDDEGIWVTPPDYDAPVICDLVARSGSYVHRDTGDGEMVPLWKEHWAEEDEANAHLIAAAPDLYRALAFAASAIKSGEPWSQTCEDMIGGALSKARGEAV